MISTRLKTASIALLALTLIGCDEETTETVPDATMDLGQPSLGDVSSPDATLDASPPPPDAGDADMEVDATPSTTLCQGEGQRGLLSAPVVLIDTPAYAPRIHVDTEGGYAVVWLTPDESGTLNTVTFGRFDIDGQPKGTPIALGTARVPQHRLVRDGDRFLVAWLNERRADDGVPYKGVRVRAIAADGTITPLADIEGTANTEHLSFGWADFGSGMLVYTLGRQGQDGVRATPVATDLTYGETRPLTQSPASSPSVAYGDGSWGITWLARDGEDPAELAFVRVDDLAQVQRPERRYPGRAVGNAALGYGENVFAVAWTRPGDDGTPRSVVTFLDDQGELLATPEITGPEGFSLVTDIEHVPPLGFAISYEETVAGGRRVGISYGSTTRISPPTPVPHSEGHAHQSLAVAGNQSRLAAIYSDDPMPSNTGYSSEVRLVLAPIGPCQ